MKKSIKKEVLEELRNWLIALGLIEKQCKKCTKCRCKK